MTDFFRFFPLLDYSDPIVTKKPESEPNFEKNLLQLISQYCIITLVIKFCMYCKQLPDPDSTKKPRSGLVNLSKPYIRAILRTYILFTWGKSRVLDKQIKNSNFTCSNLLSFLVGILSFGSTEKRS